MVEFEFRSLYVVAVGNINGENDPQYSYDPDESDTSDNEYDDTDGRRYGRQRMHWLRKEVLLGDFEQITYDTGSFLNDNFKTPVTSYHCSILNALDLQTGATTNADAQLESLQDTLGAIDGDNQFFCTHLEPLKLHSASLGVVDPNSDYTVGDGTDGKKPPRLFETTAANNLGGENGDQAVWAASTTQLVVNERHYKYRREAFLFEDAYNMRLPEGMDLAAANNTSSGINPDLFKDWYNITNAEIQREIAISSQFQQQMKNINMYFGPEGRQGRGKRLGQDILSSLNLFIKKFFLLDANNKITMSVVNSAGVQLRVVPVSVDLPTVTSISKNVEITAPLVATALARNTSYRVSHEAVSVYLLDVDLKHDVDPFNSEMDRFIDIKIEDTRLELIEVLDDLNLGAESHKIIFKQVDQNQVFAAEIVGWNKKIVVADKSRVAGNILVCRIDKASLGKADYTVVVSGGNSIFTQRFPLEPNGGSASDGTNKPIEDVSFYIQSAPESVIGQIQYQGIQTVTAQAGVPFRLGQGDYVKSKIPNADSCQYFSSLALVSSNGFLFRPTYVSGFEEPVMLELPIPNPFSISCDKNYDPSGVSLTATGDLYYATSQPRMHQMNTNIPLRSGEISVQLVSRDGSQTIPCELAPRGKLEMKILFVKKA